MLLIGFVFQEHFIVPKETMSSVFQE